ncbi:IclR family transcriptional regulator [Halorhabdus amylolytica]|uniref:IclR family transcriptional regulator n=1 Tax=Halorhabdus amylolytica TaxID=2559573 RepID=UPI00145B7C44|nr:IclR family transcriptional regulator [Halorhabdus amylolytica]
MTTPTHHVDAVVTCFTIIDALARGEQLGVTELAKRTGVAKSSVYKHLDTLRAAGYVTKTETGSYGLSLRWFEAGTAVRERQEVYQLAIEDLDRLASRTGETVSLVVEEDGDAVYIYQSTESDTVDAPVTVGERFPAPLSVGGKALLSHRPRAEIEALMKVNDLGDEVDELLTELEAIRSQRMVIERDSPLQGTFSAGEFEGHRHVVDHAEPYRDLHSVAVPIRDPDDYAVAAIEVSGTESTFYGRRLEEEIASLLVRTGRDIETALIQRSGE